MQLDPLRRLDLDYQAVGFMLGAAPAGKHHDRRLAELDDDLRRAAAHRLAGADVERDAAPAPVIDVQLDGRERRRLAAWRYSFRLEISLVLPADGVGGDLGWAERLDGPQDLYLLIADEVG